MKSAMAGRFLARLWSLVTTVFLLAGRIQRVENGLLPAVTVKDRPAAMKLADRMSHYNTPGVRVAVIHNSDLEWARGFSKREARTL